MILVTYHDEQFTKGIILNRPTNLFLGDADFLNVDGEPYLKPGGEESIEENSWQIWFGGDVRGLYSENSEINCLHSIDTETSRNVSEVLLNNIMMTNYEGATQIIKKGEASAKDFWMFAGSCGWTGGQLLDELNRDSWYMISTAESILWKELIRQRDEGSDPREAGIQTWYTFMDLIDKEDEAKSLSESFADLTLKEYCTEHLLFNSTNEASEIQEDVNSLDLSDLISSFSSTPDTLDKIVKLALNARNGLDGTLLRGSSNDRSPFTLSDQKFHKSILLILQDDDELSVAMLLNHPTTKTRPITLSNGKVVEMVVRYGGSFGIPGVVEQPIIFLHNKSKLKKLFVGEAIGNSDIWICTEEQIIEAISEGNASHKDFMVIEGFSIWGKEEEDGEGGVIEGGLLNDILEQKFEVVEPEFTDEIWVTLLAQAPLSIDTLDRNCRMSSDAWSVAGRNDNAFPSYVYKSKVTTTELADDALRYWIEAFLLGGVISSSEKYSAFD